MSTDDCPVPPTQDEPERLPVTWWEIDGTTKHQIPAPATVAELDAIAEANMRFIEEVVAPPRQLRKELDVSLDEDLPQFLRLTITDGRTDQVVFSIDSMKQGDVRVGTDLPQCCRAIALCAKGGAWLADWICGVSRWSTPATESATDRSCSGN